MKIITHLACATLLSLAALTTASASPNNEMNSIFFLKFNVTWNESPSNALAQITPPLMALAASAKTNAIDQASLYGALLHLVSTNALIISNTNLLNMKYSLIIDAFRTSGTFASSQEDEILPLARTLALIAKSFVINASTRRARLRAAPKAAGPYGTWSVDDDESKLQVLDFRLQQELNSAYIRVRNNMITAIMKTKDTPQQTRDSMFSEIVSLRILTQSEASKIAEHWGIATPFQVLPNQPD